MKGWLFAVGFTDIQTQAFQQGSKLDLLRDDPEKKWETLYVEAQKPLV